MTPYSISWWALVVAIGGLGAACRYIVDTLLRERMRVAPAAATATINLIGCIAVGMLARPAFEADVTLGPHAFLVGFLGGFTTYSTAMVDTMQLWRDGRRGLAVANTAGQFLVCTLGAIGGFLLAGTWTQAS